jgi:ADP-ribosylation factor GTPase-activating protein 2/3
MKCGGNQACGEYFQKHGLTAIKDPKSKYGSSAGQAYKEKLAQKAREDAIRYPDRVALDDDSPVGSHNDIAAKQDFFDESAWESANKGAFVPVSAPAKPTTNEDDEVAVSAVADRRPSGQQGNVKKLLLSSTNDDAGSGETKSTGTKRKGKLGVKKVQGIKFDEMEEKAKEEAQRLEALSKQGLLEEERKRNEKMEVPSVGSTTTVKQVHQSTEQRGFGASSAPPQRPGFGATVGAAPTPKQSSSSGSSNNYPEETSARSKFGGAKAISSDMYFGRNAHAPADPEQSARLQTFSGQTSISSAQFYGRDEDEMSGRNSAGNPDDLVKNFAKTFVSEAAADLENVKNLASVGAAKFQDFLKNVASSSR